MKEIVEKHRGVGFDKRRDKWFATIKINKRNKFLGYHLTFYEAKAARLKFENDNEEICYAYTKKKSSLKTDIINDYQSGMSQTDIGKKYSLDPSTICEKLHNSGIEIRSPKMFTPDKEHEIIEKYKSGVSSIELSEEYNCNQKTITNTCIRGGMELTNRKYLLKDANFLKRIDVGWKSYFLGLFAADGSLWRNVNPYTISITLTDKMGDSDVLIKLSKLIFSKNTPFDLRKNKNNSSALLIHSKEVFFDILNYFPDIDKIVKTENLYFPELLPKEYFWDFMRGFYDGDGWVTNKTSTGIIAPPKFCYKIKEVYDSLGLTSYLHKIKNVNVPLYRLYTHKKSNLLYLYEKMYHKDCNNIFIERKHKKFLDRIKNISRSSIL